MTTSSEVGARKMWPLLQHVGTASQRRVETNDDVCSGNLREICPCMDRDYDEYTAPWQYAAWWTLIHYSWRGGGLTILHHAGHYGYVPKTQFRFHPPPRDVCRGQELNLGFRVGSAVLEPPSHCSAPQFKGQRSREVLCVTGRWKLCAPWLSVVSRQNIRREWTFYLIDV